jgi:nitronate monooxygenase
MTDLRELTRVPVMVAPMGGGPTTPELVIAAAEAGAIAFLASAYKRADELVAEMDVVRPGTNGLFGVNVFVPGAPTRTPGQLAAYLDEISPDAQRVGTDLGSATWDDDAFDGKIESLIAHAPPVVSFTFGCPSRDVINALRKRGILVIATVTSAAEAKIADHSGVDALCAQGIEAGAHRGTFANESLSTEDDLRLLPLLAALRGSTDLPLIAAGGVMTADDVDAALAAGATAVQCGTAFLRCGESGASPTYKAALVDPTFTTTALTRAFSGRPARGLVNDFMRDHPDAPAAYPEINNATRPMRAAAAKARDPHRISLWAGEGWRAATTEPAGEIIERLASGDRRS